MTIVAMADASVKPSDLSLVTESSAGTDLDPDNDTLDKRALCEALKNGDRTRAMTLLLESHVIPSRHYSDLLSSLLMDVITAGRRDLVRLFLKHGPSPYSHGVIHWRGRPHSCCSMTHAICTDQADILEDILLAEANPGLVTETVIIDEDKSSTRMVLHTACKKGAVKCFDMLTTKLLKECKLNEAEIGETPLHIATEHHPEFIQRLVELGSDVSARNYEGETPLMLAATHHPSRIPQLLRHGAEANVRGHLEQTALHNLSGYRWLCRSWKPSSDYVTLAKHLVQAGLSVADSCGSGSAQYTALDILMIHVDRHGNALANFSTDINMNEEEDFGFHDEATFRASCRLYSEAVRFLVEIDTSGNNTKILSQAVNLNVTCSQFLVRMEGDAPGERLQYYASYFRLRRDIIRYLLENGADADSTGSSVLLDDVLSSFLPLVQSRLTSTTKFKDIVDILLDIFTQLVWHGAGLSEQTTLKVIPTLVSVYMNFEDIHLAPKLVSVYFDSLPYSKTHCLLNKMCSDVLDRSPQYELTQQRDRFCDYLCSFKPGSMTLKGIVKDSIHHIFDGRRQLMDKVQVLPLPTQLQQYLIRCGH